MNLNRPAGNNVNDHMNVDEFYLSFCRVDGAVCNIPIAGRGVFMAKVDIQHAFTLVPVGYAD